MASISEFLANTPWFFAFAIPAVLLVGLSKGGLGGMAMLGTPLLILTIPVVKAAAIMLPILVFMDMIGIYNYRNYVKWSVVKTIIPGAVFGIVIGTLTASYVSDDWIRIIVGIIGIVFGINQFVADYRRKGQKPENLLLGSFWGTITGFTSFIIHAGIPPFQAYAIPLKMEKMLYAGTTIMVFAIINAVKLLPYFMLGQFNFENLSISFMLMPIAFIGVLAGIWLVKRVSQSFFYNITYAAMVLIGIKLLLDGKQAVLSLFV